MNRIQNIKKEDLHMKITVAIDSLKGSLASMEAGNAAKDGILWQMAAREPWMP